VGIIPAAAAEQKYDNYYDQNCTHHSPSQEIFIAPAEPEAYIIDVRHRQNIGRDAVTVGSENTYA